MRFALTSLLFVVASTARAEPDTKTFVNDGIELLEASYICEKLYGTDKGAGDVPLVLPDDDMTQDESQKYLDNHPYSVFKNSVERHFLMVELPKGKEIVDDVEKRITSRSAAWIKAPAGVTDAVTCQAHLEKLDSKMHELEYALMPEDLRKRIEKQIDKVCTEKGNPEGCRDRR